MNDRYLQVEIHLLEKLRQAPLIKYAQAPEPPPLDIAGCNNIQKADEKSLVIFSAPVTYI